jgi:hypothetical protein
MEHFFAGGGVERRPALPQRVLIALSGGEMHREDRSGYLLGALFEQASEDRVSLYLIEQNARDRLRSFRSDEPDRLVGLPDVRRRRGRDHDCDIR